MALTKVLLSGSAGGRQIKVAATATAGTTIHTTGTSSSVIDEVWLYVTNNDAVAIQLTVEWGGTTDPDDRIILTVPAQSGLTILVEGLPLTGDGSSGRIVRAYAATANKLLISGYVNRIS